MKPERNYEGPFWKYGDPLDQIVSVCIDLE